MTILDGKRPRFYFSIPTADGKWMIASTDDGRIMIMSSFVGSQDDVETICTAWNKSEMERYKADSHEQATQSFRESRPTLEEIAARHGIKL